MKREEIIDGLQFTVEMFLFNPSTGEKYTEPRNDMDKTTIDACRGAIKELQDNSYELWKESYEVEHERNFRLKEKIKALEQQPCEDAISRILKRMWNCRGEHTTSIDKVKMEQIIRDELPYVTPQQKTEWIPISEGLPKEYADVICCTNKEEVFIATYLGKMNDGVDCFDDDNGMMWEGDVIAWMPLPQPYKEGEDK